METLEFLKSLFGVCTALFTVLTTLYGFYKWLRRKKRKAKEEEAIELVPAKVVRYVRAQEPEPARAVVWPWVLGALVVLMWFGFFGFIGLVAVIAEASSMDNPPFPPDGKRDEIIPVQMQKAPVDLTGDWTVHTGALVTITQNGNRISMRVQGIYLLNGTVEESSDPDFLARVNVSDGTTTGRYLLTRDGRLTGSVDDGFLSAESVLTRR